LCDIQSLTITKNIFTNLLWHIIHYKKTHFFVPDCSTCDIKYLTTWFIRYRKWTDISCPNTPSTTMYRELLLTQKWVLGGGLHHSLASKLCLLCDVQICIHTCLHCTVDGIIGHYVANQLWVGSAFSWTHCIVQNILWRIYLSQIMWQYWAMVSGSPAITCSTTGLIPIEEI
jgi:hypothetical protein